MQFFLAKWELYCKFVKHKYQVDIFPGEIYEYYDSKYDTARELTEKMFPINLLTTNHEILYGQTKLHKRVKG